MNERVRRSIPDQNHTFENIMQRYYIKNPHMLYRHGPRTFYMPTSNTSKKMANIFKTHEALKKKNEPGGTMKSAIVLSF